MIAILKEHGAKCLLLFLLILCLSGCGGCHKTPEAEQQAEEKAKKKEKEKEPFEAQKTAVMPSPKEFSGLCKPGHWVSLAWPDVKANRGDFQGELQTQIVDRNNHKVPLLAVPYEIAMQRPAALAKDQPKSLESSIWIPPQQEARSVNLKLMAGDGGPAAMERSMLLQYMPSYRYYFIVLSQVASRYEYLDKKLASIHLHRSKAESDTGPKYYEVVSMPASRRPSLPSNALYWTSIAYLLWDDFDPAQWDINQQHALVDWLHWGGQIIVSGPDALEQLQNSFLRPYLPATVAKSRTFSAEDLAELSYWAGEFGPPPRPVKSWPGADLKKERHTEYLPYTGDLLVERQVGRGRIVASAFRLTGTELTGWAGYDCFFNACLLRRPAREFWIDKETEELKFRWADTKANSSPMDAAKMTAVRYFSRDAGVNFTSYAADVVAAQRSVSETGFGGSPTSDSIVDENSIPDNANAPVSLDKEVAPGLGAWNDFSPVAQAARTVLANAAGISVPERSFIIWVVVGYLFVLVPANWIVFRLLGRVEWAWIAAPLIAIACTVVVIQQAQLNVGFARSRNEIAVIEMQPGYSRVHVAHYTALYTSLTTRYELCLGDPGGQILPFPRVSSPEQFEMPVWQTRGELVCRRGDDTQLTGFNVGSNVVDFVHSEEMAEFGGTVTLHRDSNGGLRVTNGTTHLLDDCRAVCGLSGGTDLARIGRLEPGATAVLKFKPYSRQGKAAANYTKDGLGSPSYHRSQGSDPSGELSAEEIAELVLHTPRPKLNVEEIAEVALQHQELRTGEICLVARVADDVLGLTVTPVARQSRQAAILVAHLDAGRLPDPDSDTK